MTEQSQETSAALRMREGLDAARIGGRVTGIETVQGPRLTLTLKSANAELLAQLLASHSL